MIKTNDNQLVIDGCVDINSDNPILLAYQIHFQVMFWRYRTASNKLLSNSYRINTHILVGP